MTTELAPSRFRPTAYTEEITNGLGVVYFQPGAARCYAIAYKGRALKHAWHYSFQSPERMHEAISRFLTGLQARETAKAARRAEAAAYDARNDYKPGDIIYNSWGYEQTNVDWFVVISVSRRFLTLQECASRVTTGEGNGMSGNSTPDPENLVGQPERHAAKSPNQVSFRYGCGFKWDGRPRYCSWYA